MVKRIGSLEALLGLGALLGALTAASCAALVGLDGDYHEKGAGGSGGAGGSSGGGGSAGAGMGGAGGATPTGSGGSACVPSVAPDPPPGSDDGGDIDFVVAVHDVELDEKDIDATVGLDIDGACTCLDGAPPTCTPVADVVCDGPGGIDNAVGLIFAQVHELSSIFTSGQLSAAAAAGQWTSLFRVRGYNGEPDDAKVEAFAYTTQGVSAGMPAPKWDGNDEWPVDDTSLMDPMNLDSAIVVDPAAYVSGGVLVVHLNTSVVRMRSAVFSITLALTDFTLRAKLEAEAGGGYRLTEGKLSGKWRLTDAFPGLASIRYGISNKLCTDDDNYVAIKASICGNADVRLDGGAGACDALSFGAGIVSFPAKLGKVVAAEGPPQDGCDPMIDPATDKCN